MPKQGFKNQWIAISRKGKVADNTGTERDLSEDFLTKVVANFTPNNAPAVIGHPKENNPAFGWVSGLRFENGVLEAQFADTDDDFERMVEEGKFKKRSASFYIGEQPALRHVGFLGAMPPAVKGLRDIQFNDGDSVTVEISFSEENQKMKDEEVDKVAESFFSKFMSKFKSEAAPSVIPAAAPAAASFSEADAEAMFTKMKDEIKAEAKAEAVAEFTEKIKDLQDAVNANSASGKKAEIIAFVESIPAASGKHFLKQVGVVEFLEACADADAKDTDKAVVCFSEEKEGKREEVKFSRLEWAKQLLSNLPSMISFGESFGSLKASAEVDVQVNPEDLAQMRQEMGVETNAGGAK